MTNTNNPTALQKAEMKYWYSVIRDYLAECEDWRSVDAATQSLLDGKHNQEYICDEIEYPVLRHRQLKEVIMNGGHPED